MCIRDSGKGVRHKIPRRILPGNTGSEQKRNDTEMCIRDSMEPELGQPRYTTMDVSSAYAAFQEDGQRMAELPQAAQVQNCLLYTSEGYRKTSGKLGTPAWRAGAIISLLVIATSWYNIGDVSYTHLDEYKRQAWRRCFSKALPVFR